MAKKRNALVTKLLDVCFEKFVQEVIDCVMEILTDDLEGYSEEYLEEFNVELKSDITDAMEDGFKAEINSMMLPDSALVIALKSKGLDDRLKEQAKTVSVDIADKKREELSNTKEGVDVMTGCTDIERQDA